MLISESYKELNRKLHAVKPSFGSHSPSHAPLTQKLAAKYQCRTILDYGCGKGGMAKAITKNNPRLSVHEYDPAVKGKETAKAADLVVAFDVLEHIEPECLNDVLQHIHGLTGKCFYCVIATRPSKKFLEDGRNAHLIVKPAVWWAEKIGLYFSIRFSAVREDGLQCVFEGVPQ